MKRKVRTLEQKLELYEPEPNTGCWLWVAGQDSHGYGRVHVPSLGLINNRAHRLFWIVHRGKIPDGLHVLHKCDTPLCVNPDHLFLGTHEDNMVDKARKGRHRNRRALRRKLNSNNTTGFRGVFMRSGKAGFVAQIRVAERHIYLGCYQSAADAARAYDKAAKAPFGDRAWLNFQGEEANGNG